MNSVMSRLGHDDGKLGVNQRERTYEELFNYLISSPRHIIIINPFGDQEYVIARDAGEEGYYYSLWPQESPDDVIESDLNMESWYDLDDIVTAISENS